MSKQKATLTFYCYANKLDDMHNYIKQFMSDLPVSEPQINQQTGMGQVEVTLNTKLLQPWHNTITLIVNQLIMTKTEPELPTIEEWARASFALRVASKAVLYFHNDYFGEWSLDIQSGIVTNKAGQILYQPGQEG